MLTLDFDLARARAIDRHSKDTFGYFFFTRPIGGDAG
jgi:hypothetical protein